MNRFLVIAALLVAVAPGQSQQQPSEDHWKRLYQTYLAARKDADAAPQGPERAQKYAKSANLVAQFLLKYKDHNTLPYVRLAVTDGQEYIIAGELSSGTNLFKEVISLANARTDGAFKTYKSIAESSLPGTFWFNGNLTGFIDSSKKT